MLRHARLHWNRLLYYITSPQRYNVFFLPTAFQACPKSHAIRQPPFMTFPSAPGKLAHAQIQAHLSNTNDAPLTLPKETGDVLPNPHPKNAAITKEQRPWQSHGRISSLEGKSA